MLSTLNTIMSQEHPPDLLISLIKCIEGVDVEQLQKVITEHKVDLNSQINGLLLLNIATKDGHDDIVKLLLDSGATPMASDVNGNIAMHFAVRKNRLDIGRLLLQKNGRQQFTIANKNGQSPLDLIHSMSSRTKWRTLVQPVPLPELDVTPSTSGQSKIRRKELAEVTELTRNQRPVTRPTTPQDGDLINYARSDETFLRDDRRVAQDVGFIGNLYQLNILALLSLCSYKDGIYTPFRLASEVSDCGKFDDVVFECTQLKLMQIKHKSKAESSKIGLSDVFTKSKGKETDFSLPKYFNSYCLLLADSKVNMEQIDELIIISNTNLDHECLDYFVEDILHQNHVLHLESENSVKRYKIEKNKIEEVWTKILQFIQYSDETERTRAKEKFVEFSQKFRLFLNYPNEQGLRTLIRQKIGEIFHIEDADIADNRFINKLHEWYKQLKRPIITKEIIDEFNKDILQSLDVLEGIGLHMSNCDNLLDVDFTERLDVLEEFTQVQNLDQILIIETSSVWLTSARVVKQLEFKYTKFDEFIFVLGKNLVSTQNRTSQLTLKAFSSTKTCHLLVVLCEENQEAEEAVKRVAPNLITNSKNKKIILITKHIVFTESAEFNKIGLRIKNPKDTSSFNSLSRNSQQRFMNTQISFQGRDMGLGEMMSSRAVDDIFSPDILYQCLSGCLKIEISVNDEQRHKIIAKNFYITRRLVEEKSKLMYSEEYFYTPNWPNKFVIVHGDPGLGKTSLLSSIALNLNERNKNIWAIKIKLNDFVHDSSKETHLSHINFSVDDADKAIAFLIKMVIPEHKQQTLTFNQQLTKKVLAYCLSHKFDKSVVLPHIILLFDACDEIAPHYTARFIRLLRLLSKTNVSHIFISTRNHEADTVLNGLVINFESQIEIQQTPILAAYKNLRNLLRGKGNGDTSGGCSKINLKKQKISPDDLKINKKLPAISIDDNNIFVELYQLFSLSGAFEKFAVDVEINDKNSSQRHCFALADDQLKTSKFLVNLVEILNPKNLQLQKNKIELTEIPYTKGVVTSTNKQNQNDYTFLIEIENFSTTIRVDIQENVIKIGVKMTNTILLKLEDLEAKEQADFLFKYFKGRKDEILSKSTTEDNIDTKIRNIFSLFAFVTDDFEEFWAKALELLGYEEKSVCIPVFLSVKKRLEKFLQTPLHLNMLAEISIKGDLRFASFIHLHHIYKELFILKGQIYSREKQKLGATTEESHNANLKQAARWHRIMSRSLLLNERIAELERISKEDAIMILKFGLTSRRDDQLEFIHRSFAEYFLSVELWETIKEPKTQRILFEIVFTEDQFWFVRAFFDSQLRESNDYDDVTIPFKRFRGLNTDLLTSLQRICYESNFNVLRLLLKTLKSDEDGCYEFLKRGLEIENSFFDIIFRQNKPNTIEIFCEPSNFNPYTFGCCLEILNRQWKSIILKLPYVAFVKPDKDSSYFLNIFQDSHLKRDKFGNSLLHGFQETKAGKLKYLLKEYTYRFNNEILEALILSRNYQGLTFIMSLEKFYLQDSLLSLKSSLPEELFKKLLEAPDTEGNTFLYRIIYNSSTNIFWSIHDLPTLSDDFFIITIYDNIYHKDYLRKELLNVINNFKTVCENENMEKLKILATNLHHEYQEAFEDTLGKLNDALIAASAEDINRILSDSKDSIRELILSCNYKMKSVLENLGLLNTILGYLRNHVRIYQHWVLKVMSFIIEFDCNDSFAYILKEFSEIAHSWNDTSVHTWILHYVWKAIEFNRSLILQQFLNFIETFWGSRIQHFLLYGDLIILRYDIDFRFAKSDNETKKILLHWVLNDISSFDDDFFVELLMFKAEYPLRQFCTEDTCRERIFRWLKDIEKVTRVKMHKILFGTASFGFTLVVEKLIIWIQQNENNLSFNMIDVLEYKYEGGSNALHMAARAGNLATVIHCFDDTDFRSDIFQLVRQTDNLKNTVLHKLSCWNDIDYILPSVIKKYNWAFILSENLSKEHFIHRHSKSDYFLDILEILKKHSKDIASFKTLLNSVIDDAARFQPDFLKIVDFLKKAFPNDWNTFLYNKTETNGSILHIAARYQENFYQIIENLVQVWSNESRKGMLISQLRDTDNCGWTLLHRSTYNRNFVKLLEFLFTIFTEDEMVRLLAMKNNYGAVFFCSHRNRSIFPQVLSVLEQKFSSHFLKQLFLSIGLNDMCVLLHPEWLDEAFTSIVKTAVRKLTDDDLGELLAKPCLRKDNVLHHAFRRGLAIATLQVLPKKYLKNLLCELDFAYQSPFSYFNLDKEEITKLVDFLVQNFSETDLDGIFNILEMSKENSANNTLSEQIEFRIRKKCSKEFTNS